MANPKGHGGQTEFQVNLKLGLTPPAFQVNLKLGLTPPAFGWATTQVYPAHRLSGIKLGRTDGRAAPVEGRSRAPPADRRGGRIQHSGVDMTFAQIPAGAAIFLDANTLVYHPDR